MISDIFLDGCLFGVVLVHAGAERQFTARLVDFDDDELLFDDSHGEVVVEPRHKVTKIALLNSERYGNYNYALTLLRN
jgi:hypothetical protein